MMRIAICGGIGSGKSAVSSILRSLGAKVLIADEINAELLASPDYIDALSHIFPTAVHNHIVDKKELSRIVFSDEKERVKLMELAHGKIYSLMMKKSEGEKVVFFEIPLMSMCPLTFDSIWFVKAKKEDRILKIMARDDCSKDRAERLVELQADEEKMEQKADYVICNNYEYSCLKDQVASKYYFILEHFS